MTSSNWPVANASSSRVKRGGYDPDRDTDYSSGNGGAPHRPQNEGLLELWRNVLRHRILFAAITGSFCAAGAIYWLTATPQYRADALLRLQNAPGPSLSALSGVSATISSPQSTSDQSDILNSRSIVSDAIAATGAEVTVEMKSYFPLIGQFMANRYMASADQDDTAELAPPFLWLTQYAWGGERLEASIFTLPRAALGRQFIVVAGANGQWTLYNDKHTLLTRGTVGKTSSFSLNLPGTPSAIGQLRIDTLRARPGVAFALRRQPVQVAYDAVERRLKTSVPSSDSQLIAPTLIRLSYQANTAVAAQTMVNAIVRAYLQRDVELRAEQARRSLEFLHSRLPGLKQDLETAENRLSDYRTRTQMLDMNQQNFALVTRMNELADKRTTLELQLAERKQSFTPESPTYQATQAELDKVQQAMRATSAQAIQLPDEQREYVQLERAVTVSAELYTSVLANAQQLEVAAASTAPGASVIDWAARPNRPSWPRGSIIMLGACVAGLFAGVLAVHLKARSRRQFMAPEELDGISALPRLAVVTQSPAQIGHNRQRRNRLALPARLLAMAHPMDPTVEALRALRSSMQPMLNGSDGQAGHRTIAFTGPTRGVGKSFVASNFAYLLAERSASVLLIDADMRQGDLACLLDDPTTRAEHGQRRPGLANVLQGQIRADEAIVKLEAGRPPVSILEAGTLSGANPAQLLGSSAFRELLEALRDRYDFIVIDSPPVLPVSDALLIAEYSDVVLIVSRAELTSARQLDETQRRLTQAGAHIGGHVFNGFSPMLHGVGNEYGLHY